MASDAYYHWVNAGKPYKLAQPVKDLQATLRGHGLTVYDYPNDAHLTASTPEDHTPFSATGWPVASAFGIAHAIDVMPRSGSASSIKENADIARRLIADKDAGVEAVKWIKYLNWTDEHNNCYHVSWQPNKATKSSSDRGHIHVSGRSDMDNVRCLNYDPLGPISSLTDEEDTVHFLIQLNNNGAVFLTDGVVARWLSQKDFDDITHSLYPEGTMKLTNGGKIRSVGNKTLIGRIVGPVPEGFEDLAVVPNVDVSMSDAQLTALSQKVGDMLVASPDNGLTDSDKAAIVAAVKQALSEGVG